MTADNLLTFLIVGAVFVLPSIISAVRAVKRASAGTAKTQPQPASAAVSTTAQPQAGGPRLTDAQIERVHMIEAQLARRGITPPPALQAVMNAFEAAAAPPPPPPVQQQPQQPQPQHQSHRHRHQAAPAPDVALRQTVPVARSLDVPPAGAPVAADSDTPAAASPTRRMLASAFGDAAHARNAVVLTEILGPPVALR